MAEPTFLSWDWKSRPSHDDLVRALSPLGIRVYQNPKYEGSDSYGYIFSDHDLTSEQVKVAAANEEEE